MVVDSIESSSNSSWGGSVDAVSDADSIPNAEVGYPTTSSRLSWVVMSSRTLSVVLYSFGEVEVNVEVVFGLGIGRVHSGDIVVFDERMVLVG